MGMVTSLYSYHFHVLCSFISTLHSTLNPVSNQPPEQGKHIQVMGHSGKDMTFTKVVMVGSKCCPLHRFHDKGRHRQVHRECLQDRQKIIQSISQYLPVLILQLNHLPVQLGDLWLASQR
jgi:hypothetical protein